MNNVALGPNIYIFAKTILNSKYQFTDKKKWTVPLPLPVMSGSRIEWKLLDSKPHKLEIDPPKCIIPGSLVINGNHATAEVDPGAKTGYYEYVVHVDGEFADGGSAPGMIIG
jgi:hypothetical protein